MTKLRKLIKKKYPRLIPIEKIWEKCISVEILERLKPTIEYATHLYFLNAQDGPYRNNNKYIKGKCINFYAGFGTLKPQYTPDISNKELLAHIGGVTCHWTSIIITEFLNIIYPEEEWKHIEGEKHSITISKDGLLIADALEKYQKRKNIKKILEDSKYESKYFYLKF